MHENVINFLQWEIDPLPNENITRVLYAALSCSHDYRAIFDASILYLRLYHTGYNKPRDLIRVSALYGMCIM